MTSRQLRIFELVLVLAIGFLPSLVASIAFTFTGNLRDFTNYDSTDYIVWILHGLLSITLMFYILFKNNRNSTDIGLSLKFNWKDLLIGFGLLLFAGALNAVVAGSVHIFFPEFINQASNPKNLGFIKAQYKGFLTIATIIIPLQEELIVRGYTMTEIFYLTDNRILAIIISVAIQFSYHLYQGLASAIFMLPYFILISIYFLRTGNLNPVIFSHILIDLIKVNSLK
jgi:membrane protease YdiL (CAAX protease family)